MLDDSIETAVRRSTVANRVQVILSKRLRTAHLISSLDREKKL